jgi:hypothetical protein
MPELTPEEIAEAQMYTDYQNWLGESGKTMTWAEWQERQDEDDDEAIWPANSQFGVGA